MKKFVILAILLLIFSAPPARAEKTARHGHEVGSNGDRVSTWIHGLGYQILDELKRREALGTPLDPKVSVAEFEKALNTPIILIDDKNEKDLTNAYGEVKDVKYVMLKDGSGPALLFHRSNWTDLYNQKRPDYQTVAHGYFYACGLDDRRNYFSSRLAISPPTVDPISVFRRKYSFNSFITTKDGGYLAIEGWDTVVKLDELGIKTWSAPNPRRYLQRSYLSLLETQDGAFLALGRIIWPGSKDEARPFVVKLNQNGETLWEREFCVRPDRNKKFSQCQGDGVVQAIELSKGQFLLLVNETHGPLPTSYVVKMNGDSGQVGGPPDEYWEAIQLFNFQSTRDEGFLFSGWRHNGGKPKSKLDRDQFYIKKTDGNFRMEWERTLFAGRAWKTLEPSSGGFLVVGAKHLAQTSFPDLKTEPVLVKLGKSGNPEYERSLYFADANEEFPDRMGRDGEAKSVFEDSAGDLWIAGSNNLFERERRQFYFGDDGSFQFVEKSGFVYTLPKVGDAHFKIFPGTSSLAIQPASDGKLVLQADHWFSKIWSRDL